jgi:cysteinyl-tRNA synthetase
MSKSLGNSFLPNELFSGSHPLLEQAYSPMTARFFMLQSQYRSTLDFSNEALKAAEKGYKRLINGLKVAKSLNYQFSQTEPDLKKIQEIETSLKGFHEALCDDLNTSVALAELFNLLKFINMLNTGQLSAAALGERPFRDLVQNFIDFTENILGLIEEPVGAEHLTEGMLELYKEYKSSKEYGKVDQIRSWFRQQGLVIKDLKDRIEWAYAE